jgi:hypothetical protein
MTSEKSKNLIGLLWNIRAVMKKILSAPLAVSENGHSLIEDLNALRLKDNFRE